MAEPAATASAAASATAPPPRAGSGEDEEAPRKASATEVERLLARVGGSFPPAVAREANQLLRKLAVKVKPGTLGKVSPCGAGWGWYKRQGRASYHPSAHPPIHPTQHEVCRPAVAVALACRCVPVPKAQHTVHSRHRTHPARPSFIPPPPTNQT